MHMNTVALRHGHILLYQDTAACRIPTSFLCLFLCFSGFIYETVQFRRTLLELSNTKIMQNNKSRRRISSVLRLSSTASSSTCSESHRYKQHQPTHRAAGFSFLEARSHAGCKAASTLRKCRVSICEEAHTPCSLSSALSCSPTHHNPACQNWP